MANSEQPSRHAPGATTDAPGDFLLRFWGVRGSIACPGPRFLRYGGNTSCLEVRAGGKLLIFDGGTGLRPLGETLLREQPVEADIFLSHTHVDHIQGFPFFQPLFAPGNRFRLWAGNLGTAGLALNDVLCRYMATPLFPVPPQIFAAEVTYHDFTAGERLRPRPGLELRTAPLNHPQGATAYRLEHGGRSLCYVTDTEHVEGSADNNVLRLVDGADTMVYDATYSDEEYPRFRGWGHSTWQEALRIADQAGVRRVVLFHHDPSHDDETMDRIANAAERARPGTLVAREGMELAL